MGEYDLAAVEAGQVWFRDPMVHTMRESFACSLKEGTNHGPSGPYIGMEYYVLVAGWYDEPVRSDDTGRVEANRKRGFCRWYHLLGFGWIHESNLFGFFRRVI